MWHSRSKTDEGWPQSFDNFTVFIKIPRQTRVTLDDRYLRMGESVEDGLDRMVDLAEEDLRLRDQLKGKRLICEAPFGREKIEALRGAVFENLEIAWDYPSLAAVVTVGSGVYYYETGTLWDHFPSLVSQNQRACWGKCFEKFIGDHATLEAFHLMTEQGAHRYVAPILAHGGVPHSCLKDLFSVIGRHCTYDQNGLEALEYLQGNDQLLRGVNKPVKRFIRYGGETAEELLGRLLALWRSLERSDVEATFGLPRRIADSFAEWYRDASSTLRRGVRHRFPSPAIYMDPRTIRINLDLPACFEHPDAGEEWLGFGDSWPSDLPVEIPLLVPRNVWEVSCGRRDFRFRGICEDSPVMFFEVPSGRFIRDPERRRLPEDVWALCREEVKADPCPVHCKRFPQWDGFSIVEFDLHNHKRVVIGDKAFDVRRPFFREEPQPIVRGAVAEASGVPVFSAVPRIDWDGEANLDLVKDGQPQGNIDVTRDGFAVFVDEPGEYQIELRGPLGQNLHMGFQLIPGFSVAATPEICWPDPEPITWHVEAPAAIVSREENTGPAFQTLKNAIILKVALPDRLFAVRATIPSLEWCLNITDGDGRIDWSMKPIMTTVSELSIDGVDPILSCRLALDSSNFNMTLEGENTGYHSHSKYLSVQGEGFWRFSLGEVRGLLDRTGQAEKFDLVVASNDSKTLYRGHIIEIRPEWDLGDFGVDWKLLGEDYTIQIHWSESGVEVKGRWLTVQAVWRPWEQPVLQTAVPRGNRGHYQWDVPCHELRPGRYRVCAIHAPWGLGDDPKLYEPQGVCFIDIHPESWPEVFSLKNSPISAETYLEAVLAHWYRPERVEAPRVPNGLLQSDILSFLKLLEKANAVEPISSKRQSGPLPIFCSNSEATSSVVAEIGGLPDVWEKVLPPSEFVRTKIGGPDRNFLFDLVLNWDNAANAAKGHRPKELCEPLRFWRKALLKTKTGEPPISHLGSLVFLCEKFDVFRKKSAASQSYYEALKTRYFSQEMP